MSKVRPQKVQELIKIETSQIISREIKDPRIGFVTVTEVTVTPDLREAKIFVSLMGDEKEIAASWAGLNSAKGFVRRELGRRVRLRYTPEIEFVRDTTLDYSEHIQKLLKTAETTGNGE